MPRLLITVGLVLVAAGLVWFAFPKALSWFGNLPGDVRMERGGTRVFIPLTSMLVVSVLFTLVVNGLALLARLFR